MLPRNLEQLSCHFHLQMETRPREAISPPSSQSKHLQVLNLELLLWVASQRIILGLLHWLLVPCGVSFGSAAGCRPKSKAEVQANEGVAGVSSEEGHPLQNHQAQQTQAGFQAAPVLP